MLRLIFATVVIFTLFINFAFCQTNVEPERFTTTESIFKVGEQYALPDSASVSNITLIGGDAHIKGKISRDVFVFVGNVKLEPSALVEGNVTTVLGSIKRQEGAQVKGRILEFNSSNLLTSIINAIFGLSRSIWRSTDWLWWSLSAAIVIFFLQAFLVSTLPAQTENMFHGVARRPVGTLLIGLVVTIAMFPAGILLFYSVVGIPLLLFLWALIFAACIYGKIAISLAIGNLFLQRERPGVLAIIIGYTIYTMATFIRWYYIGQIIFVIANVVSVGACIRTLFGMKSPYQRLKRASRDYSAIQE